MIQVKLDWSGPEISAQMCRVILAYLDHDRTALGRLLTDVPREVNIEVVELIGKIVGVLNGMVEKQGFGWGGDLPLLHNLLQDVLEPMVDSDTAILVHQRFDEVHQGRLLHHVPASVDDVLELHLAAAYATVLTNKVMLPGEFRRTMVVQLAELGQPE